VKIAAENRKQTIVLSVFGSLALGCIIYLVQEFTGGPSTPTTPASTVTAPTAAAPTVAGTSGRAATVVAANSRLDPTLHMEAMLLTESLEYTGTGRNIFSTNSAPLESIPKAIAPARTVAPVYQPPVATGPPPPPPIDLKFFGTATRADGTRRAFLLRGEDVFLASEGDIVSRRYKVESITANSVQVTDLQTNNSQRLPLAAQ